MYNKKEQALEKRTFSVENIIVDESQLFIFYRIDTKGDHRYVGVDYFSFLMTMDRVYLISYLGDCRFSCFG